MESIANEKNINPPRGGYRIVCASTSIGTVYNIKTPLHSASRQVHLPCHFEHEFLHI